MEKSEQFRFRVICNVNPCFSLESFEFIPWKKETEIEDLLSFDIGIMPLKEDRWTEGKCGFKALQYLALEIPALASPVGVNTKIVQDNVNGYLCGSFEEWETTLKSLLRDPNLRSELGKAGKETVKNHFSVQFVTPFSFNYSHETYASKNSHAGSMGNP